VNVAEVMYTSPVVPREPSGLKTGLVHLRAPFLYFMQIRTLTRIRFDPVSRGAILGGLSKGRITFFRSAKEGLDACVEQRGSDLKFSVLAPRKGAKC